MAGQSRAVVEISRTSRLHVYLPDMSTGLNFWLYARLCLSLNV